MASAQRHDPARQGQQVAVFMPDKPDVLGLGFLLTERGQQTSMRAFDATVVVYETTQGNHIMVRTGKSMSGGFSVTVTDLAKSQAAGRRVDEVYTGSVQSMFVGPGDLIDGQQVDKAIAVVKAAPSLGGAQRWGATVNLLESPYSRFVQRLAALEGRSNLLADKPAAQFNAPAPSRHVAAQVRTGGTQRASATHAANVPLNVYYKASDGVGKPQFNVGRYWAKDGVVPLSGPEAPRLVFFTTETNAYLLQLHGGQTATLWNANKSKGAGAAIYRNIGSSQLQGLSLAGGKTLNIAGWGTTVVDSIQTVDSVTPRESSARGHGAQEMVGTPREAFVSRMENVPMPPTVSSLTDNGLGATR